MTITDVDRVFLDTNVLLAATDESRAEHEYATRILTSWPVRGITLYLSGQILREYLVVATRPVDVNGLGLDRQVALANVDAIRSRTTLVAEDTKVHERLRALLAEAACTGKQIHDANVVATMLVHGIETLVTRNVDDFVRFERHIAVINPLRA